VEIIAENVEMVCTSTVSALYFENCTNVTLRGLTVDYDPLPFTQGKIIAMAPDKSWMDFEVAKGYPENELQERIQIYDPATGELRRGDASWNQKIEALGEHRYRVGKGGNYRFDPLNDTEQVGDILVTNNHFGQQASPHAIALQGCKRVRLEDITVFPGTKYYWCHLLTRQSKKEKNDENNCIWGSWVFHQYFALNTEKFGIPFIADGGHACGRQLRDKKEGISRDLREGDRDGGSVTSC
jgi:hypothetical protein